MGHIVEDADVFELANAEHAPPTEAITVAGLVTADPTVDNLMVKGALDLSTLKDEL